MYCVPLMSASPSLASSTIGSIPARARASAPDKRSLGGGLPFAEQNEREVRERREIARRADRALCWNPGHDIAIEQGCQTIDELLAHSGVPQRQHLGAQHHHRAHLGRGESGPTPHA